MHIPIIVKIAIKEVNVVLKILILEDEKFQIDRLAGFLNRYKNDHPQFVYTLETYERGLLLLDAYKRDADIVFLDIKVPDMLGMDVAQHIRKMDKNVMIMFVTNLTQYAIDGYSVEAFDYILKPLHYASFCKKMDRALRVLSYREPQLMLDLRTKDSGHRIPADCVTHIEISAHNLLFYADGEVFKQWGTLSEYEELLRKVHFARSSSSFLVNLKYVRGIKKDEVLLTNGAVPLSRAKRKEFLAALAQYKGGSI